MEEVIYRSNISNIAKMSIVIKNETENRLLFLYTKFFLELCGWEVLEERDCPLESRADCGFRRVTLAAVAEKEPAAVVKAGPAAVIEEDPAATAKENQAAGVKADPAATTKEDPAAVAVKDQAAAEERRTAVTEGGAAKDDDIWILTEELSMERVIAALCIELADSPEDEESLTRIAQIYDRDLFRELYTVSYLYASRLADYGGQTRLKMAAVVIAGRAVKWEGRLLKRKCLLEKMADEKERQSIAEGCAGEAGYSWRDVYAYLYMANKANEGLCKYCTYPYRPYSMLRKWLQELGMLTAGAKNLMLEADIIRNTKLSIQDHIDAYRRTQESPSYCIRFWSLYALGELYTKKADIDYEQIYGDEDCGIKVEMHEPAMPFLGKCLELKRDEVRIVYKQALQEEWKGKRDWEALERSESLFLKIVDTLCAIPPAQRTTLEFEYLFKSYVRLGYVYMEMRSMGKIKDAGNMFDMAEKIWKNLSEYTLFKDIYGDEVDEVIEILKKRHGNRELMFDLNRHKLQMMR